METTIQTDEALNRTREEDRALNIIQSAMKNFEDIYSISKGYLWWNADNLGIKLTDTSLCKHALELFQENQRKTKKILLDRSDNGDCTRLITSFFDKFKAKIDVLVVRNHLNTENNYKWIYKRVPKSILTVFEIYYTKLKMSEVSKILHSFSHVTLIYLAQTVIKDPDSVLKINPKTRFELGSLTIESQDLSNSHYKNMVHKILQNKSLKANLRKFSSVRTQDDYVARYFEIQRKNFESIQNKSPFHR